MDWRPEESTNHCWILRWKSLIWWKSNIFHEIFQIIHLVLELRRFACYWSSSNPYFSPLNPNLWIQSKRSKHNHCWNNQWADHYVGLEGRWTWTKYQEKRKIFREKSNQRNLTCYYVSFARSLICSPDHRHDKKECSFSQGSNFMYKMVPSRIVNLDKKILLNTSWARFGAQPICFNIFRWSSSLVGEEVFGCSQTACNWCNKCW